MSYTRKEIQNKYLSCVHDVLYCGLDKYCEIDNIDLSSTLTQMGADSLDLVELVMRVEAEFDIELPDDDMIPMIERPLSEHIDVIADQIREQTTERVSSIDEKYRKYILFALFLVVAVFFVWLLGAK